jgi:hypothetical protein
MGLFAKTGSTTWSTTKKVFAKTSTGGWSVINSVWAKVESGWQKVWPKIAPSTNPDDPINIRLNSYNGTVATGYMYIDTILYGHDGLFLNGPATASDRKFVASTSVNLNDIVAGDVETTAPLDVFNLSNNTDTTRNRIDGNYLFYQLKATNNQDPTLSSVLNGPVPPIKIIKKTPSITSTVFTEYGDGIYQMEFYASSKWYNSPDLANSYVRWWRHTDKVNYRNGTILQTDYFTSTNINNFQKFGTGWTDGSSTSPDLNAISILATTVPPSGTYIIAEVVLKNSFTTHFSTEVTAVKFSGVLPFIRNVRFEDDNGRDPTDYLNRLITDGFWYLKFDVDNVTASTTYRVDYRLYDVQAGVYYNFSTGASFTNGNSWPTQYNVTGTLSGTTAYLNDGRRFINTGYLPAASHTYGGGLVRYRLGIRITAQTPGQQRTYFTGVINNNGGPYVFADTGGEFDLNTESVITLAASKTSPTVAESITFSGTTNSFPSGYSSFPRQYKIDFGDGTTTGTVANGGWVNFPGTANPGFSVTKSYATAGTYAATLFWTPQGDKSRSTSTQITITVTDPPVNTSAPTLTGTNLAPGGVLNFDVGSWTKSPTTYTVKIYRGTANVAVSETLVSTQILTAPTTTGTYTITQEDYTNTGISPVRRYLRIFVTANNGSDSVQKSGGEVGPVSPPTYTITWKMNDGTDNSAGTPSTFLAGGSVTAPSPTRANYTLTRFADTASGDYLYSVLPGANWSPPSGNRNMFARWTYTPPSYTFVFGNKISVSTNGYISLGDTSTVAENKTTTAAATSGKVLAILPHDARQTALYYFSDTVKYVVRWIGATYNNAAQVMAYEIAFYKDQQYADFKILNRSVAQQSNDAYLFDAGLGSGVITSYPLTPTELSRWRVYFNSTTPITPITYTELSLSVMKRDTTQDGVDDNTTTLTTATNQTAYVAPHFPPFFPPHFPPFFPPFFPPHFPPFFPPHFPPFFPPHFPPFFPPYFATPTLPAVPTGLAATNDGSTTSLTWNAATGATSYEIFYWSSPTYTGTARDFFGITGTSYSHTTASLWYYFVRSRNAAGVSAYSPGVLATSTFTPPYFPGPPGGY